MRDPGAVVDGRGLQTGKRARDCRPIEKIDRLPQDARITCEMRLATANVRPCRDPVLVVEKMINEVAAGKACGARDQRRTRHVRQSDATTVLRVVVGAERWVVFFDRAPPPFVVTVPSNRVTEPRVERHLGAPPKLRKL